MANNLIQIKRSLTTAVPASLANGEFAFTSNGDILYIGANGSLLPIAGKRVPGTLTANQALVANSTSGIDKVVVANLVSTSIWANGSSGTANQVLRSSGTNVYWADDVGDISSITAGNGLTGGGTSGDVTLDVVGANGISVSADAVGVITGSTLTVNTNGIHVNTNLSITSVTTNGDLTVNGNTKLGDSASDVVSFNAVVNTSIMPAANVTYNLGNNAVRWNELHASNVHSETGYFDGNLQVGGDLIVAGNVTTTNVNSVVVSDPMIYLAGNNYTSDLVDIGFAANYYDGATQRHTGFFRDATDGVWKLFANSTQELSGNNTVNTIATGYTTALLQTYLTSGGLQSNATHVAITANSTIDVSITANSITLNTPLATTSGGTGTGTYAVGDLLVGNTSNTLTKLPAGTDGYVLQINGAGVVAWNTLDGGTF